MKRNALFIINKAKKNGITLIALVITIIILLILAGITINLTVGQNGIIQRSQEAKKEYEKEAVREKVSILIMEHITTRDEKQETFDDFLNRKKEEGEIDDAINNGDGTHTIITDGYEIIVDDETLEIIEIEQETWFKRITRGKAKFVYTIESEHVADVDVGIEIDESIRQYTTQYKIGEEEGTEWISYTFGETFKVKVNGTIYGRIVNQETGEIGYEFETEIKGIDTKPPQNATITFNATSVDVGGTIQATVAQEDLETGIDLTKSKYIIDTSSGNYGITSDKWKTATTFTQNPQIISITQSAVNYYYVHVLSSDMAGNLTETRSEPIYFRGWVKLYSVHTSDGFMKGRSTFDPYWVISSGGYGNSVGADAGKTGWAYSLFTIDTSKYSTLEMTFTQADSMPISGSFTQWGVVNARGSQSFLASAKNTTFGNQKYTGTISLPRNIGNVYIALYTYSRPTTSWAHAKSVTINASLEVTVRVK